jgi:hypothetical protein
MTTQETPVTKTATHIFEQIMYRNQVIKLTFQRKIDEMLTVVANTTEKTLQLEQKIPVIIGALTEQGLGIDSFSYSKTGRDEFWDKEDKIRCSLIVVPVSGKFKFIKDQGFTAKGAGKNDKQLEAKADKLIAFMEEKTGLRFSVNKFCLQYTAEDSKRGIIMDFTI